MTGSVPKSVFYPHERAILAHKKSRQERIWSIPYGFKLSEGGSSLIKHEMEQKVLILVNRLKSQGMPLRAIAEKLIQAELKPRGRNWHPQTIARIAASEKYVRAYFEDGNCCTVVAFAIAARVSLPKAREFMARHGRKQGRGMSEYFWRQALQHSGLKINVIDTPRQPSGSLYTMRTIGKAYPKGYYLVECRGHVAAMVNGEIRDWADGSCQRIMKITRVIKRTGWKLPMDVGLLECIIPLKTSNKTPGSGAETDIGNVPTCIPRP